MRANFPAFLSAHSNASTAIVQAIATDLQDEDIVEEEADDVKEEDIVIQGIKVRSADGS